MASRRFYSRKSSAAGDKRRRWPFSELPPTNLPILPHILETNLQHNNRSTAQAITKSWLPTTARCSGAQHQRPQLRHVTDASPPPQNADRPRRQNFISDSTGIAETALQMPDASHWCLLKSTAAATRADPPPVIPTSWFDHLGPLLLLNDVLGPSSPSSGLTVWPAAGRGRYWYVSVRHECAATDPFDARKKPMEFASMVESRGKFYATSLQGALAVMQVIDTRLRITAMGTARAVPSSSSRFFKEYLVEMKGEILLVFLIYQKSLAVVDNVEVFRLDLDKLGLIKVERLRGKTMFLNERCVLVDSAELRLSNFLCKSHDIYQVDMEQHARNFNKIFVLVMSRSSESERKERGK